jgi:transcriptional regulator with XRE-family HTH domain
MKDRYLEVTFRKGRPLAAYLYLPREVRVKSARTVEGAPGILVDYSAAGIPIGLEITAPELVAEQVLTLVELAEQIGVVPSALSNWLSGSRAISVDKAADLAAALSVDVEEISTAYETVGRRALAAGTLVDHRAEMHDVLSILVDLAVRGYLVIEERERTGFLRSGKEYRFHLMRDRDAWEGLQPYERLFLEGLFTVPTAPSMKNLFQLAGARRAEPGPPEGALETVRMEDLQNRFYKNLPGIRDAVWSTSRPVPSLRNSLGRDALGEHTTRSRSPSWSMSTATAATSSSLVSGKLVMVS